MSKFKVADFHIAPLCLKLRGRIVGAVSRTNTSIYIASGLLFLGSMLLMVVFFGLKDLPSKTTESAETVEAIEDQSAVIAVSPQEIVTKPIEQPVKDVPAVSKNIRGPIKVDFGWQLHEVYKDWRYHTGIDISGAARDPVEAIYNGQVTDIFHDKNNGLTVVVKNSTYSIYYGSLSDVKVKIDSNITAGQIIGTMGSCDAEPYTHLHLGVKKGEQFIDPKLIINQE